MPGQLSRRGPALTAVGAAICALLVGCGGGSGGPSTADFAKQAEAICKKARAGAAKDFASHDGKNLSAALSTALNEEADGIAALDPPSDQATQIEALVASVRKAAVGVEAGNDNVDRVERAAEKAEREADRYELEECFVY